MSQGRRMGTGRAMALAACIAALRFVSRRGSGRGQREGRLPVALRWRRERRRLEKGKVGATRAAAAVGAAWRPQLHLHFDARVSVHPLRGPSPRSGPAAPIREARRLVLERHWLSVRLTPHAARPRQANASSGALRPDSPPSRKVRATEPVAARSPGLPFGRVIQARVAYRPPRPLGHPAQDGVHAGTSSGQRARPLAARTMIRQRGPEVVPTRGRAIGNTDPRPMSAKKPSQAQPGHPPPALVWRRARQNSTEATGEVTRPDAPPFPRHAAAPSSEGQDAAPGAPARTERSAALQVTNLDPGLLERLTDSVVRQVERRVRIERERRGI